MEIQTGRLNNKAYKVVIYGQEGVGKSTLASQFPKPLFLDLEGSTDRMDVHRLPTPQSWSELLQTVGRLTTDPPEGYRTLVIDTVSPAERLCCSAVIAENPSSKGEIRDSMEQFGWQSGYKKLGEEWATLLEALTELREKQNWHVVLLAHATLRKFDRPEEDKGYDRWEMNLENKPLKGSSCFTMTKEWCEMLLFACYKTITVLNRETQKLKATGEKRVLYTSHTAIWDGKNRHGLDDELPLKWESIAHLFRDSEKETKSKPADVPKQQPVSSKTEAQTEQKSVEEPSKDADGKVTEKTRKALKALQEGEFPVVTDEELMASVAKQGYFPADMPVEDLPEEFVAGKLVPAWKRVVKVVAKIRKEQDNG